MKILIIVAVVLVLWSLWGYFSSRVEQAEYTVLRKADGYEVREYSARIVAQTTVDGTYDEALNKGFSIIAGYIFGGNVRKESVAMTAPVTVKEFESETIAMTAPVVARADGAAYTISFVMPKSYTLDSLPTPVDSRVTLVQEPAKKMAVLRFSTAWSAKRVKNKEEQLLSMLSRDAVKVIGNPAFAGYNAPWAPPWMIRNEVMVEIE